MLSKKRLLLYLALLFMAVAIMVILRKSVSTPPTLAHRDYPEIKKEGILRIKTEYNQSGYFISGDTIQGFQYELSQSIAKLSGLQVMTDLEMSISNSFADLSAGQCDIIARNIPVTSTLKEKYLFTDPIVLNRQVLVQRTAKANKGKLPLRNQLDLAGKTLYVTKDSPALLRLQNLEAEIGDNIHIKEDSFYSSEQLIIMVAKGDIDYAVCDLQIAKASQPTLPEIDIETDISFTQLQSWAVRKDSPILLDSLNKWLKEIHESGLYRKIYKRYYK